MNRFIFVATLTKSRQESDFDLIKTFDPYSMALLGTGQVYSFVPSQVSIFQGAINGLEFSF